MEEIIPKNKSLNSKAISSTLGDIMKKIIIISLCILVLLAVALSSCSLQETGVVEQLKEAIQQTGVDNSNNGEPAAAPTPTPAARPFDETYDFSFTHPTPPCSISPPPCGGQKTQVMPPGFFRISNGIVSSSDATVTGSVLDNFGNVRFTAPCWTSSGGIATWTGIMNALSGPKFGEGKYVCQNGIIGGSWHAYNGK